MKCRPVSVVVVAVALSLLTTRALAADFIIHTQNLLHFGQGSASTKQSKCNAVEEISKNVDVILIQEVMQSDYPCPSVPDGFVWESYGPLGPTSYKEFYGFLWREQPRAGGPRIEHGGYYFSAEPSAFARPPHAIILRIRPSGSANSYYAWIGNIHSIFGSGVKERRAEATAAAAFFAALREVTGENIPVPAGGFPVIIGGDWNLAARNKSGTTDSGFEALAKAGAGIEPNVPTSLNPKGKPSSAYDHFVFTTDKVSLSNILVYPDNGNEWPKWRSTVSDHLGVHADVTFH